MKSKRVKQIMQIMKKTTIPDSLAEPEVARYATDIDLQEEIRRRPYELFEQRGRKVGTTWTIGSKPNRS